MKIKKILIVLFLFILCGCKGENINNLSVEEIINSSIENPVNITNTNAIGYKYYLPNDFTLTKDDGYNNMLLSDNTYYYLNIDVISYYYNQVISTEHKLDDYLYYEFGTNETKGFLRITKSKSKFLVELCYNYAIIEAEVENYNIRYAVSRGMSILTSIKYNDLVIDKYISDGNSDGIDSAYNIPGPAVKKDKNVLEYIEEDEE